MSDRTEFRRRATSSAMLLDGATGTMLQARGVDVEHGFDLLNLTRPEIVADVHRAYLAAGADIIETNTFGSNRFRLAEHGAGERVVAINTAAAKIARDTVATGRVNGRDDVLVAGSVGPLGVVLAPIGRVSVADAHDAFAEQIAALVAAGVDLLLIETMPAIAEVKAAVAAARSVDTDLPIVVMVTFADDDRTLLGMGPAEVARELSELDIDGIGVNCSTGPNQVLRLASAMRSVAPDIVLAAAPNAGFPERGPNGRVAYPATPEYFADYAGAFVAAGVSIIGGCCGTSEAHIGAMRIALDMGQPSTIAAPNVEIVATVADGSMSADPPTALSDALTSGRFITTVEMRPPKGIAAQKMTASAAMLHEAGADFLDIADIPLARMRMSAWAAAHLVQLHTGAETILHFPTRGRNLLRVQADLLAAHALGVRNLFVTMGDPARIGDHPDASDEYDVAPTGLIKLITEQMNAGLDQSGAALDQPTSFTVGAAASLTPTDIDREATLLNKKARYGVDFVLTQPCFDAVAARRFLTHYRAEFGAGPVPILLGIQPLYNSRNAEFLHNEVPGISIPQHFRDRMRDANDPTAEGRAIATEIAAELRDEVQGVYIIPAFGRYDIAADLLDALA